MLQISTLVSHSVKTQTNRPKAQSHFANVEPSEASVQNILNYSKALIVKKSDAVGFIEVVTN